VTKDSLATGTEVLVEGFLAKSGENKANGANVTLTDGRKLFLGSSNTAAEDDKSGK
jgi:primosomal replication protein N